MKQKEITPRKTELSTLSLSLDSIETQSRKCIKGKFSEVRDLTSQLTETVEIIERETISSSIHMANGEIGRLNNKIKLIKLAKEAATLDEYGMCQVCDIDIPIEKMRLQPMAINCTDCQSKIEFNEKLFDN